MATHSPPKITFKPQRCPEAVIEWYRISGLQDRKQSLSRKDVALKAKQHLSALGWNFWYIEKKGRRELRYKSPTNDKSYISLRKACESCIADGGCDPENVPLVHPSSPPQAKKRPRKSKIKPRRCKKITRSESTSEDEEEGSSTVGHSDSDPVSVSVSDFDSEPSTSVNIQHKNDSVCSVCNEGGDIIMCDRCPSSFHTTCIGLVRVPDGDWFCPRCSCKICDRPRCREECAGADNVDNDNNTLVCAQCEQRCHLGCLQTIGFANMESHPNWFCSVGCGKVFSNLQKLVGKPIPVGEGNFTWRLLKTLCSDDGGELPRNDLGGFRLNESKLRVALDVLHECFGPIISAVSGRDMIRDIVFCRGSGHIRLNFRGFYTVILEKNEEVVSVASVRIYGQKVAEIAFVATKKLFQRQGMCRILMNELEKQLTCLGVGSMVLHSTPIAIDTWTKSFAFARMTSLDKSPYLDYTFLEFDDTILCHKPLVKFAGIHLTT